VAPIDWEVINARCADANAAANLSSHQRAERRRLIEESHKRVIGQTFNRALDPDKVKP
jgi:hypothetical protein